MEWAEQVENMISDLGMCFGDVAEKETLWKTFFNGEGTAEWQLRGHALDSDIRAKQPSAAMEVGA